MANNTTGVHVRLFVTADHPMRTGKPAAPPTQCLRRPALESERVDHDVKAIAPDASTAESRLTNAANHRHDARLRVRPKISAARGETSPQPAVDVPCASSTRRYRGRCTN